MPMCSAITTRTTCWRSICSTCEAGRVLDRREFFWEDLPAAPSGKSAAPGYGDESTDNGEAGADEAEFDPGEFFSSLLKQLYIDQQYVPHTIYVPVEFEDRDALEQLLAETRGRARAYPDARSAETSAPWSIWSAKNAKQSYDQRFRVLKPTPASLPRPCRRLHAGGAAPAHRVLRHFAHPGRGNRGLHGGLGRRPDEELGLPQVHHPHASTAWTISPPCARWWAAATSACRKRSKPFPSLILIDGGMGQLHAAAEALEALDDHRPAAGLHRQARGDHLRAGAGRRAHHARPALARCCTWCS